MRDRILIATTNKGKADDFSAIFDSANIDVVTLLDIPDAPDIEETGSTFAENAILKAETMCKLLRIPVIADDSGLCVAALGGIPNIYSARYAGSDKSDDANMKKLAQAMKDEGVKSSVAYYQSAVAMAFPDGETVVAEGKMFGIVRTERKGTGGFGYDQMFYTPAFGDNVTFAELPQSVRSKVSHRAIAIGNLGRKVREIKTK